MRARIKLIVILAVFIGPLLASFIWYYGFGAAHAPRARGNYAPLISPAVTLAEFRNATPGGVTFTRAMLLQKWNLIHLLPAQCGVRCEKSLYHTRQVRLALGRRASRVRRIFVSPNSAQLTRLAREHPDATGLLEGARGVELQLTPLARGGALLADPLGNVMMRIPAEIEPGQLLKDLKKLLKLSRIG